MTDVCDTFDLVDLSRRVATYLTEKFGEQYTARHNSEVVYPLEELNELKVDVWPAGLAMRQVTKGRLSSYPTVMIAMQQRAKTQEKTDLLTTLSVQTLSYLLLKRFANGKVYSSDGDFVRTNIFDMLAKYEENVFQSIMQVNFQHIV